MTNFGFGISPIFGSPSSVLSQRIQSEDLPGHRWISFERVLLIFPTHSTEDHHFPQPFHSPRALLSFFQPPSGPQFLRTLSTRWLTPETSPTPSNSRPTLSASWVTM